MARNSEGLADFEKCGLPSALEAMGERWSFLILRAALSGVRHFEEFQSTLGIARNILANRLSRLVENGILDRHQMEDDRRKVDYRLTRKGVELLPVMLSLRQWGEKWGAGVTSTPILADKRDRRPIARIGIFSHDGRPLELEDMCWIDADAVSPLPRCAEDCSEKTT